MAGHSAGRDAIGRPGHSPERFDETLEAIDCSSNGSDPCASFDAHVHYGFWDKLFSRGAEIGFLEALSDTCEEAGIEKVALLANPGRRQ